MALKLGSSGPEVSDLQRMIAELGVTPAPVVNGRFDAATELAVKKLQKKFGTEDDGIVGRGTLAAVAKGKVLGIKDSGPEVRALQLALGLEADGRFGSQTEARVTLVQQNAGLNPPDGRAGKQTWAAIAGGGAPAAAAQRTGARSGGGQATPARASAQTGQVGITIDQARTAVNQRQNIKLSPNFDLATLVYSPTARGAGVDNWPQDPILVMRLSGLCMNMLEPLASRHGRSKININSGYRNKRVNRMVGSKSDNSNHVKGYAADMEIDGVDNRELWQWVKGNMRYHELILEFYKRSGGPTSGWVHVAFAYDTANQMRAFTIG
jgi:zinc D-Ala-D-Ala carboxypeptidase